MRFGPLRRALAGMVGAAILLALAPAPTLAAGICADVVAKLPSSVLRAAYRPRFAATTEAVGITFLGHASFLLTSPGGVTAVTDYNGYLRPKQAPDIVTMNHAHPSHYTDDIDPAIKLVLRGWQTGAEPPSYDVKLGDVRVRNIPTNIRNGEGGTEYGGNSIFIFQVADLCIAHLGHLHHTLTPEHLARLGQIDVLLAPVDGAFTLNHQDMLEVIDAIHPAIVIPMHYFGRAVLDRFLGRAQGRYPVREFATSSIALTRSELPNRTEIWILPGS